MNKEVEEKYNDIYNKFYSNDVCSIDQMNELEALGIDTSDASCMWTSIQDKDHNPISWLPTFRGEDKVTIDVLRIKFPLTYKEGNVYYCYTLGDLIKKLPNIIRDENGDGYLLIMEPDEVSYYSFDKEAYLKIIMGVNTLDTLFKMIKWLKINNYDTGTNKNN